MLQLLTSRGVSVSESAEEGVSVCERSPGFSRLTNFVAPS